ncbi:His Kinase A (phospho-acceptor) domain-containing protein [Ruminococcaceae bacterium YAD3003]|nr:His Kinase A (phospho-acceptor) domain-containing protein [Ruminococcaceae bacterium YAD3003]
MILGIIIFTLIEQAFKNPIVIVVLALILILIGILLGYLIGNTTLQKSVTESVNNLERDKVIQKAVLDTVGLGIAVYDSKGALFCNETIFRLPDFLKGGLPKDINGFLETFDNGNQLKSNYILSLENGVNLIRVNYINNRRIYEIKIIRRPAQPDSKFFGNEEMNIVIVDDITQIKDDERRQKDLAANVSHELKTPLTSIKSSVFSIRKSCQDGMGPTRDELITWSGRIEENTVRMQDIVNDFLVLSQCSHTSRMEIFDIRDAVNSAYMNVQDYPGASNVRFTLPDDNVYPLLYGNSKLIVRTIVNLLTNAIKYISFEGKKVQDQVHISISVIDDRVAVQVDDNGRGIPAKDIEHLFERFYRVDNSGNREVGGSGIGLAIAKEIADMHDGVISVTSTFGQGATFILSLPTGKTVFDAAYSDAKAGIISDKPLHRAAAYFLGLQECEAVRSLGYKDLETLVDEYEIIPEPEVAARDKALAKLLSSYGDERFEELKEELLYVEDFEDEEDGPVTGLEQEIAKETTIEDVNFAQPMSSMAEQVSIPVEMMPNEPVQQEEAATSTVRQEIPQIHPQVMGPSAEELAREEEEARLQAKEEARKLLTQPVVQISAEQRKTVSQLNRESREKHVIHPIDAGKRYNSKSAVNEGQAVSEEAARSDKNEVAVKSSLKKILDDSNPHK